MMGEWVVHHDRERVLGALQRGEFDHVEILGDVLETRWIEFLLEEGILCSLASTYPTPRKKQEFPLWIYVASELSLRLHGAHSFHALPLLIQSGGLLEAIGPNHGRRHVDPQTGDLLLRCPGFNRKNRKERRTPVDQDTVRKLARTTSAVELQHWFTREVGPVLQQNEAIDPEGLFVGDATYLFVPDNPRYEGSDRLLFDRNNHLVDSKEARAEDWEARGLSWRRCYKLVTLLHVHPNELCFTYVGMRLVRGAAHEIAPFYDDLLPEAVSAMGRGTIKTLVVDRGFLDGARIGRCKKEDGIDVLIPLKSNMELLRDAQGLARDPDTQWVEYHPPRWASPTPTLPQDSVLRQREQTRRQTLAQRARGQGPVEALPRRTFLTVFEKLGTLESCPVPLGVILMREEVEGRIHSEWALATTRTAVDGVRERARYEVRSQIEERHRQLKGFWDLMRMRSRAFSLVVNHAVFTLPAFTLLELFLFRVERELLNPATIQRIRRALAPSRQRVAIYHRQYWTTVSMLEYTEILVNLSPEARRKIACRVQELGRNLGDLFQSRSDS